MRCLANYPMGEKGLYKCCSSCVLGCLGWPVSPCLTAHLSKLRKKLSIMHREHGYEFGIYSWRSVLCWPANLAHIFSFVKEREEEGSLVFDWDLKNYKDHLQPRPEYETKRVFLIGPRSGNKGRFMEKLLTYCDSQGDNEGRQISYPGLTPIHIGVKAFQMTGDSVCFLEIWDIPEDQMDSVMVKSYLPQASGIFFVFDFSDADMQSFHSLQALHEYYKKRFPVNVRKFCVATNMDHVDDVFERANAKNMSGDPHKMMSKKSSNKTAVHPTESLEMKQTFVAMDIIHRWATRIDAKFLRISYAHNSGLKDVYKEFKEIFLLPNADSIPASVADPITDGNDDQTANNVALDENRPLLTELGPGVNEDEGLDAVGGNDTINNDGESDIVLDNMAHNAEADRLISGISGSDSESAIGDI